MKARKTTLGAIAVTASLAMLTACGGGDTSASSTAGGNKLEIVSYWTAGSEVKALNVLTDAMKAADPGIEIVNAAVAGGGGANARASLATRLAAHKPPSTWQVIPGFGLQSYVQTGEVADLDDFYKTTGLADKLPDVVLKAQQFDGKYYSVPIDVARGNVLWTNPKVLKDAGADLSKASTVSGFLDELAKVKIAGGTPVCLGDKDGWSPQVLEAFLMAELSGDTYTGLMTGKESFDSPDVKQAVNDFLKYVSMANTDSPSVTWDQALDNLSKGKCAVNMMGDWAYGQLTSSGAKPSTDFSWTFLPTANPGGVFDYVGDSFAIAGKNNANPKASQTWLEQVADPKVQLDFNKYKGSVAPRKDVSAETLSQYQQESAKALSDATVVLSTSNGLIAPPKFTTAYMSAVNVLVGTKNVDQFVTAMTQAQKSGL